MNRKLVALSLLAVSLIALVASYSFWLEQVGAWLIVRDKLEKADVIVVLAGDDNGERVAEAVKLYKTGYAPYLLVSGGPLAWHLTSAEWMKKQAVSLGVPAAQVLTQDRSRSTQEDARFSLPLLKKLKAKEVILVTSPTHSRRALRVFKKVCTSDGIKVISWPARQSRFRLDRWWTRYEDMALVVWEYVAFPAYLLRGY
jgi:uncharacterized SAM-binding protein YcdF (DUF218 family)